MALYDEIIFRLVCPPWKTRELSAKEDTVPAKAGARGTVVGAGNYCWVASAGVVVPVVEPCA